MVDRPTPIYDELAAADAVLGVYSTAVFEGLAFGLPTVIAKLPGWEATAPLVAEGAAVAVGDAGELRAALADLTPPTEALRDRVWRPRARANFQALLEELLRPEAPTGEPAGRPAEAGS